MGNTSSSDDGGCREFERRRRLCNQRQRRKLTPFDGGLINATLAFNDMDIDETGGAREAMDTGGGIPNSPLDPAFVWSDIQKSAIKEIRKKKKFVLVLDVGLGKTLVAAREMITTPGWNLLITSKTVQASWIRQMKQWYGNVPFYAVSTDKKTLKNKRKVSVSAEDQLVEAMGIYMTKGSLILAITTDHLSAGKHAQLLANAPSPPAMIVMDENEIRNLEAKRGMALLSISSAAAYSNGGGGGGDPRFLLLTATPYQNGIADLVTIAVLLGVKTLNPRKSRREMSINVGVSGTIEPETVSEDIRRISKNIELFSEPLYKFLRGKMFIVRAETRPWGVTRQMISSSDVKDRNMEKLATKLKNVKRALFRTFDFDMKDPSVKTTMAFFNENVESFKNNLADAEDFETANDWFASIDMLSDDSVALPRGVLLQRRDAILLLKSMWMQKLLKREDIWLRSQSTMAAAKKSATAATKKLDSSRKTLVKNKNTLAEHKQTYDAAKTAFEAAKERAILSRATAEVAETTRQRTIEAIKAAFARIRNSGNADAILAAKKDNTIKRVEIINKVNDARQASEVARNEEYQLSRIRKVQAVKVKLADVEVESATKLVANSERALEKAEMAVTTASAIERFGRPIKEAMQLYLNKFRTSDRPFIVFANFLETRAEVTAFLEERSLHVVQFVAGLNASERALVIQDFQGAQQLPDRTQMDKKSRKKYDKTVLRIAAKTGHTLGTHIDAMVAGVGLLSVGVTLTAACDVLMVPETFNPTAWVQAEGRVNRASQTARSVNFFYLVARTGNTGRIMRIIRMKWGLALQTMRALQDSDLKDFQSMASLSIDRDFKSIGTGGVDGLINMHDSRFNEMHREFLEEYIPSDLLKVKGGSLQVDTLDDLDPHAVTDTLTRADMDEAVRETAAKRERVATTTTTTTTAAAAATEPPSKRQRLE
jgi:hypothetical protein